MNTAQIFRKQSFVLLTSLVAAALVLPFTAGAAQSGGEQTLMERASDAGTDIRIHLELEAELAQSDALSALEIGTDVQDGVVHLNGAVDTGARKELAGELAKSIQGVTSVKNELEVVGEEPGILERIQESASEGALTARVKTRLLASRNTSGLKIDVSTDGDVVTLNGDVNSETERDLAGLIAGNTAGVAEVRNELKVANRPQ